MFWLFLLFFILLIILLKAYQNTFLPILNHVDIAVQSREDYVSTFAPLKILHLSDLHMEKISVPAEYLVNRLQGQSLDLIAITGDLLDREDNIAKAKTYVEMLHRTLQPAYGTYIVFGNHDYVLPADKLAHLKSELESVGCHVLLNCSRTLDLPETKLHIIGIDDYHSGNSDICKSFENVNEAGLRLILTHDPNIILQMKEYHYDYLLAGHFHGGQIHWPKAFHLRKMGSLPKMNIIKGLHYFDERPLYISEGLGQTGINLRLRSKPEITVHTLQSSYSLSESSVHIPASRQEIAPSLALEKI